MGTRKEAQHRAEQVDLERQPFVAVLDQTKWWRTGSDGWVRRKKMSNAHKLSTLGWLERNARNLVRARERWIAQSLLTFPEDPSDGVFAAMTGIEAEHDEALHAIMAVTDQPCVDLIRETAMYQALLDDVMRAAGRMQP